MAIELDVLVALADEVLQPAGFDDYCPNGLQVEGRSRVTRLVSGVTACQQLLDAAAEQGADAILVHHGLFWRGENPVLTGMKKRRVASLLRHDISLLAYHLPLDAHPDYGNNASLARLLGISVEGPLAPNDSNVVGNVGSLETAIPMAELVERISRALSREPLFVGDAERRVSRVAWCTGGGQGYIEQAVAQGADVYITGEVSEQTVHVAREEGIQFIAAGHHATERYGVQALGHHLAKTLAIEHQFIDVANPA
jgi:dinuclear metal center YbgI/SA1388 family protein